MRSIYPLGALLLVLAVWGCGGGGGSPPSSGGNGADQSFAYGRLDGHAARITTPIRTGSSGVSVVGQTGLIHALELQGDRELAHTKIAYVTDLDGYLAIYVINPDGSNPTRLTNRADAAVYPCWSPDGTRIAFTNNQDGHIYVMHADGSHLTRLTSIADADVNPSWSPDGARIAFVSHRDGLWEIYVMNADGSRQTRLTHPPDTGGSPSWFPDGVRIGFAGTLNGTSGLYTINADGTNLTYLTSSPVGYVVPSWSPDGARVALVSSADNGLYIGNADGSHAKRLANNANTDAAPSWSPDGSRILYDSSDHRGSIYRINADGSNSTRLPGIDGGEPAWSPFPPTRNLIGAGGQMGAGAAGFLYAQVGNAVPASIVTFSQTVTAQPLLMTSPSGLQGQDAALVYDLEVADNFAHLSDLRYWNLADPAPVQVDLSSGLTATGAFISFGSGDGLVHSVLLFNGASGFGHPQVVEANGQRVARGHFVGVWDGEGKNLAPQGASEVTLDARTGHILTLK